MTTQAISQTFNSDHLRRAIRIDLLGWTAVGAVLAAAAGPLADLLALPASWILGVGLLFLVGAPVCLWLFERLTGYSRSLVGWFTLFNLDAGVLLWLALLMSWLPVDGALWWAVAGVADLCLIFGIIQFLAWRKGWGLGD
ncbi:MAG: hypothetical protein HY328_01765 [Chloroflexi bacterium]|nr:hypothetical protein [Chloroflexota bacterium]